MEKTHDRPDPSVPRPDPSLLKAELERRKRDEEKAFLLAEAARRSLARFARAVWPIIEPSTPLQWSKCHDAICEHLEAVYLGQIKNLALVVPPGSLKTFLTCQVLPAWLFAQEPGTRIICCANVSDLAIHSSLQCREIIRSEWYQKHFPHVQVADDQDLKTWFATTKRGFRKVGVVGAKILGQRGDWLICFPAGTPIRTASGDVPIEQIVANPSDHMVASFDHTTEKVRYSQPTAVFQNQSAELVEVSLDNGVTFRCTADHPVYVRGVGYTPAKSLTEDHEVMVHDEVCELREGSGHDQLEAESSDHTEMLLPCVQRRDQEAGEPDELRPMRQDDPQTTVEEAGRNGVLLSRLRQGVVPDRAGKIVRGMRRQHVPPRPQTTRSSQSPILHEGVSIQTPDFEQHAPVQDVRKIVLHDPVPPGAGQCVLLEGVLAGGFQWREEPPLARGKDNQELRRLREVVPVRAFGRVANQVVWCKGVFQQGEVRCPSGSHRLPMLELREGYRDRALQTGETEPLLEGVCGRDPFQAHTGRREWEICQRPERIRIPAGLDTHLEEEDQEAGRELLPVVRPDEGRGGEIPIGPPHRLQQGESVSRQPDHHVQILPRRTPRWSGAAGHVDGETVRPVKVQSVRPVGGYHTVYNIELRPDHNYFASGVLVHNCDDPNDATEVKSKGNRDAVINWYDGSAWNRVNDPANSRRVMIAQRTDRGDLIGHCIERHGYEPLIIPMEFESNRKYVTSIGWTDWRTTDGELMHPERFGPDQVAEAKRANPVNYRSLYQQDPSDVENALYKPEYFAHRWRYQPHRPGVIVLERGDHDRYEFDLDTATVFATCDAAADAKTTSDHTALTVFAAAPRGDLVVLDCLHERLDIPDQPEFLARARDRWPQTAVWGIEAVGSNRAMSQYAARLLLNVIPMNVKGDKVVKAQPAITRAGQGGIWFPEDSYPLFDVPGFVNELLTFTGQKGGQDDRADCTSLACQLLPTLPAFRSSATAPRAVSVLSAPRLPATAKTPRLDRTPHPRLVTGR